MSNTSKERFPKAHFKPRVTADAKLWRALLRILVSSSDLREARPAVRGLEFGKLGNGVDQNIGILTSFKGIGFPTNTSLVYPMP